MAAEFTTIRTVGGMLPSNLLGRIVVGDKDLFGLTPKDYTLPNETPREAANRVWSYLFGVWTAYKTSLARLPEGDPAVGLTREKHGLPDCSRPTTRRRHATPDSIGHHSW